MLWQSAPPLRSAALLILGANLFTLAVFTVQGFFRGPDDLYEAVRLGLPMMAVDGSMDFLLYGALRFTQRVSPWLRWSLVALATLGIAMLQSLWDTELRQMTGVLSYPYKSAFIRAATLNTYNTAMVGALLSFQGAYYALRRNQRLLDQARQREREAQMLALRFQLNPHFLFNTLNAISSLVVLGRPRDAEAMIDRLSSFLRGSLAADPDRLVTVEEEFEMLENYLEIESVRFGERLDTSISMPPQLGDAQVPPFLLQPLVENAVKYAVAPSRDPVTIGIAARERDGQLELEVCDTGRSGASAESGTGVGLANVRERLRLSFGAQGEMSAVPSESGWRVLLTMPLTRRPASSQQQSLAA
jgi:LytS/YehU family sensor histidine kinase